MDSATIVFVVLFAIFAALGFGASKWRKGDMRELGEWALAGRKLGIYLAWFLVGADLYTAYTFIAIPEAVYLHGSVYMFAVPYVMATFAVAMIVMTSLWKISKEKNYVTAVDFVKDKFNSKTLAILIAITGIVAELPYIALQIVGMQAVLIVMLQPYFTTASAITSVSEFALIVSFVILAAFTFWSGLRGAVLTAVMKDIIILVSVVVIVIAVPLAIKGGFATAFSKAAAAGAISKVSYATLAPVLGPAFLSLFVLSALALYLYPHSINGVLGSKSAKSVRYSTAMLPLYGFGLFLLALFGILIFAEPNALAIIASQKNPALVVPALIYTTMPGWFAGFAFLGIFIGGLVPAAIMAISQANLLTRNIIKEFKKDMTPQQEARIAKWASVIFKFLALGFVFVIPASYAIQLQLLGGILIVQTLPPIFMGLYVKWLDKNALIAGWFVGILSGLYFIFTIPLNVSLHTLVTSLMSTPLGLLYVAAVSLSLNVVVVFVWSAIARMTKQKAQPATA
ncbi:MAG: sodium:solute symporter [Candidatus Thermoplasmatota archaeon]|nr:sodium:solute symporter [Candidatus Thermoplasmatota archaeon]